MTGPFDVSTVVIRGVPTRVWSAAPPSLIELFDTAAGDFPQRVALRLDDRVLTYAELAERVDALAAWLTERGVRQGDRVAIAGRNDIAWLISFWAVIVLGAVAVPLNAWWVAGEMSDAIHDSVACLVLADPQRAALLGDRPDVVDWAIAFDAPVGAARPRPMVEPDDMATLLYTSGTTGRAKGAIGTHRNAVSNVWSVRYRAHQLQGADVSAAGPPRRFLLAVPLFHVTGLLSVMLPTLSAGGELVMMARWDAGRAVELIDGHKITNATMVPTMAGDLLEAAIAAGSTLPTLVTLACGGAPTPPELVARLTVALPALSPGNGYGMTETSAIAVVNGGETFRRFPHAIGFPPPVVEVSVRDPDGIEVLDGEIGELWVAGPNVVAGYWNAPEATEASFVDGWVRTGDLGYRSPEHGWLAVVDRAKDMVLRGGENVYCVEVEAAIHRHRDVLEVAVFGVPHERLGEEVGAAVVVRPGAVLTADEVRDFVAPHLARFKIPTVMWFRQESLPRNPAGKIAKRDVRRQLLS